MSEENQVEHSEQSSDQVDQNSTENTSSQEETQQTQPQSEQADTSNEIKSNGSELGLQKSEPSDNVESGEQLSENLDKLVNAALNGELSDEQLKHLKDAGIDKHFDLIVEGRKAEIAKNDAEIVSVVGGKESYAELQEWAVANLSDDEIASFNHAVLESGNIGLAKLAVEGLQARYEKANGKSPEKIIESGSTANAENRPYSDPQEYIRDTMNIRYKQDPEFAAQVEAKRMKSGF